MAKRRIWGKLLAFVVLLGLAAGVAAAIYVLPIYREFQARADACDLAELHAIPAISEVFESNGQRYSRLEGEVRYVIPSAKISPYFVKALLAREDSRFYEHKGVDFPGIVRAAWRNMRHGGVREGASTLTQQLARNTFTLGDDKWQRKCVEALLAMRIEKHFSKEQIIEAYANRIYYGIGLYGLETASRACFGKSASDLSLSEAAILAGLIRSPNRLSPLEDTRTALVQRDQVLARMRELGMITAAEETAARAEEMPSAKRLPPVLQKDYAMDAVIRDLAILLPRDVIDRGGLKIYTTIDRRLQLIAQDLVQDKLTELEARPGWSHPTRAAFLYQQAAAAPAASQVETTYIQGSLLAVDNETGGIRAIVGGRNFDESPYNRALLAKRQMGSTFKPFIYAAAFEHGLLPGTYLDDGPLLPGEVAGTTWAPKNSDGKYEGLQPAAVGLIRSRNTMTVRAGQLAGLPSVHDLAGKAGLENVPEMPAIYLGAFEATLKNVVGAYTAFPGGGIRSQPYIIDHIEDRNGRIIYKASRAQLRVISAPANYVVHELLRDVIRKGTAASSSSMGLTIPAAGKTGTTDDYKDAWFVGYTERLTCGVWVGMDRPERVMSGGYGSTLALPIWVGFMEEAAKWKYEAKPFPPATEMEVAQLCRHSGLRSTTACEAAGFSYSAQLPKALLPSEYCYQETPGGVPALFAPNSPPLQPALVDNIPTARAVPADEAAQEPIESESGNYRVIRKQNGFIFQNSR